MFELIVLTAWYFAIGLSVSWMFNKITPNLGGLWHLFMILFWVLVLPFAVSLSQELDRLLEGTGSDN